jgi:subtilisin family serine protease
LYTNGQQVAVESVDPGIGQNLAVGEVLQWTSPGPGCYATVVVFQSPDGDGIIGGRLTESDDEYRERIRDYNASPIGHGNESDVIALIEASREHGVPVEKGFVYPARLGPGTLSYCFLIKRDNYWESRLPSSAQITTVFNYVSGELPGDFSITPASVIATNTKIALSLSLDPRYGNWADFTPWPIYYARTAGMLIISAATSASAFTIATDNGVYTSVTAPAAGNTIALYDSTAGVFKRKKILTVGGAGPWAIVCDMTAEQSDSSYVPVAYQAISPWFDAINYCAAAVGKHMALLGPGDGIDKSSLPEDGTRMARQPRPYPGQYNDAVTAQIAFDVQSGVDSVTNCAFLSASETLPGLGDVDENAILSITDLSIYRT